MRPEVFRERAESRLDAGTLTRFAGGLAWPAIFAIGGRTAAWWRRAVPEAEERGVLVWDRKTMRWLLTDEGRSLVRSVT